MSARHGIVVGRDSLGFPESIRFVCHGDNASPCHWWPACDCETWGPEHGSIAVSPSGKREHMAMPGHEYVQQDSCWIDPWFNSALSDVADWVDACETEHSPTWNGNDEDTFDWLVSGDIDTTFEGEYMTWCYMAGVTA